MNKIFNKYILSQCLIFAVVSSCATSIQKKSENLNSDTATQLGKFIDELTTKVEIEAIETVLVKMKEKMTYQQIYLYAEIALTSRQNLLEENCIRFSEDLPIDSKQFKDFIIKHNIDDGNTFSFLRYGPNGHYIQGYRCGENKDLPKIESAYYECSIEKVIPKCFSVAILRLESKAPVKQFEALKKSSAAILCKKNNDVCDFFKTLLPSETQSKSLTKQESDFSRITIAKGNKAKAIEHELDAFEKKTAKDAEDIENKKKEKHSRLERNCKNMNARSCWELYVSTIDVDEDLASSYVERACQSGLKKACMVDERNRQLRFENEQQKLIQAAHEKELQLTIEKQEQELQRRRRQARKNQERQEAIESEENARAAGDFAQAFSNGMNQRNESIKQKSEEYKRKSRTINTDCYTDVSGAVHCQSRDGY